MRLGEEHPNVAGFRTVAVQACHDVPQHSFKSLPTTFHFSWKRQGKPCSPVKLKGVASQLHLPTFSNGWESGVENLSDFLPHSDPGQPTTNRTLNHQCCFSTGLFRLNSFFSWWDKGKQLKKFPYFDPEIKDIPFYLSFLPRRLCLFQELAPPPCPTTFSSSHFKATALCSHKLGLR